MRVLVLGIMILICAISCGAEKKTRTQLQAEKNNKNLKWIPVAQVCPGPNCPQNQQYKITPNCSRTRELSQTQHPRFTANEKDLEVMWKMRQMQKGTGYGSK